MLMASERYFPRHRKRAFPIKHIGPAQLPIILETIPVVTRFMDLYRAFEGVKADVLQLTGLVIQISGGVQVEAALLVAAAAVAIGAQPGIRR